MRSTVPPTKDATSCCEPAPGGSARRAGRDRAHPQLPAVPPSNPWFFRDHAGPPCAPAGGGGSRSASRVSLGLVVRPDHERPRTLLDGRGPLALHAVFRARLSRDDRDHRLVHRRHVLVRGPDAPGRAGGAAVDRLSRWLDGARMAHGTPPRRPVSVGRGWPLAG